MCRMGGSWFFVVISAGESEEDEEEESQVCAELAATACVATSFL